jgi:hypothetical protein
LPSQFNLQIRLDCAASRLEIGSNSIDAVLSYMLSTMMTVLNIRSGTEFRDDSCIIGSESYFGNDTLSIFDGILVVT